MAKKNIFQVLFGWIPKLFSKSNKPLLKAAIDITNVVKTALNSGIADIITSITPSTLDDKALQIVKSKLPSILAAELLIYNIKEDMTQEEVSDLINQILKVFGTLDEDRKAKFYTSVGAELYLFLSKRIKGQKFTFAEAVILVEDAYRKWLNLKSEGK